jgi:hypothetical protein
MSPFAFPEPEEGPTQLPQVSDSQGWARAHVIRSRLGTRVFGKALGPWGPHFYRKNPSDGEPLEPGQFLLFALFKAYNNEHMISAAVRNAFAQGVDRVFILDNGSTDHTIERAEASGATLAKRVETEWFDESLLTAVTQGIVVEESVNAGVQHVWWLFLDCDEFPEGPEGLTVKDYLATLDRQFRVVGSTFLNHLPTGTPEYISGFHPLEFQPFCYILSREDNCAFHHHKHPLQRFDRGRHFVNTSNGSHSVSSGDKSVYWEPDGIVTHHFQYGDEEVTRASVLHAASRYVVYDEQSSPKKWGAPHKMSLLDSVYSRQWEDIVVNPGGPTVAAMNPQPWPGQPLRWYSKEDLDSAQSRAPS